MKTKSSKNTPGLQSQPEQVSTTNTATAPAAVAPAPAAPPAWRGVFFDGPEPEKDRQGEEVPVWHVFVGNEDAHPLSRVYRVFSFKKAESLAQAMSKDRNLELVAEAMP